MEAARRLDQLARESGGTMTIEGGGASVTFGKGGAFDDDPF